MTRIGFIGLGRMGFGVAKNLAASGHHLVVHDIRAEVAVSATAAGLTWRASPAHVCGDVDLLITMLPGPSECRSVMLGENGALAALLPGATWIDLTSNSPAIGEEIAGQAIGRGIGVLDAPVGGDPDSARTGHLSVFVGGQRCLLERHRTLLEVIAGKIVYCGPAGSGYLTKLLINQLWFSNAVATAEMMLLARKMNLNLMELQSILADSAGASAFITDSLPLLLNGDYLRSFPIDRVVEELETVQELATQHRVPTTIADAVLSIHRAAHTRFGGIDGELLGVALLEEQAGLQIRGHGG